MSEIAKEGAALLDFFSEDAKSGEMGVGVHENVKLIGVDPELRRDKNNNVISKQLFLRFKKFNKKNEDVGEKEISFFFVDATKDYADKSLSGFIRQSMEVLGLFLTPDEIEKGFDPIAVWVEESGYEGTEEELRESLLHDNFKKTFLSKAKAYKVIEEATRNQVAKLLKKKIGFESLSFRLKLEANDDGKYIQIPRYGKFVEASTIDRKDSMLYN